MWYCQIRAHGKRVRKALSTNKREAEQMAQEMAVTLRAKKIGLMPGRVPWELFKERYKRYCESDKKWQTTYRDFLAFRMMEKAVHLTDLHQITPELLEHLKSTWQKEGKPLSAVTRGIKSIKTAMRKAEEWGYIKPQDWRTVKVKEPRGRLVYYSVPDYEHLLESCKGYRKTTAILQGRMGLRGGEVYHLLWRNVHLDLHKIHITSTPCQRKCRGCESGNWVPKGGKERWIPIPKDTEAYLRSLPKRQEFVLGDDRPTLNSYQALMKRMLLKASLPGSPHALRHTFASHLAIAGVSLKKIAGLLGHSSIKTAEVYSHLSPESLQEAISALPNVRY